MEMRPLLEQLEREEEPAPALAYLAGRRVELEPDELRAALRRALLLLATGGDPRRDLDLHGRAVRAVAADLETPARAATLTSSLADLRADASGLARVSAVLDGLLGDPGVAWRWFACALVAEELGADE